MLVASAAFNSQPPTTSDQMLTFNKNYFSLTVLLFCIEVLIALYMHDDFIRPYVGDVLVVILIYCFLKSFLKIPVRTTAILVLVFAFSIEVMQFVDIVGRMNLHDNAIASTAIGRSFAWEDFLAYLVGIAMVLIAEKYFGKRKTD